MGSFNFRVRHLGWLIAGVVLFLILAVFGGIVIGNYNSLVKQNENVSSQYAQVQNLLKKRHDKITSLYATLQVQLAEEQAVINAITNARSSYTSEDPVSDGNEITSYTNVIAVVEDNNPNYLSAQGFRTLMDEISEAENELAVGRKDYNASVRSYNTSISVFPSNIVAKMFKMDQAKAYWSVDGNDTEMPKIGAYWMRSLLI
jgi:LemA protein